MMRRILVFNHSSSGGVAARLPALVTALVIGAGRLMSAVLDPGIASDAALSFLEPGRFRSVKAIAASSTGNLWLVGLDRGAGAGTNLAPPSREAWVIRRVSQAGETLGEDLDLNSERGFEELQTVIPVGNLPNGNLVVCCLVGRFSQRDIVAVVGPRGVVFASDPVPSVFAAIHATLAKDGNLHMFPFRSWDYASIDLSDLHQAQVSKTRYASLFGGEERIPGYLGGWRANSGGFAIWQESKTQLVVAVPRPEGESGVSVYRIDTRNFLPLDSVQLSAGRDAALTYAGVRLRRPQLVPADDGGYWLYAPSLDPEVDTQTLAYRLGADLSVMKTGTTRRAEYRPFGDAPLGVQVVVAAGTSVQGGTWNDGVYEGTTHLSLRAYGFSPSGELYFGEEHGTAPLRVRGKE